MVGITCLERGNGRVGSRAKPNDPMERINSHRRMELSCDSFESLQSRFADPYPLMPSVPTSIYPVPADDTGVRLQIWGTDRQERYRSLKMPYFREAVGRCPSKTSRTRRPSIAQRC
jgi:hypothetical protein